MTLNIPYSSGNTPWASLVSKHKKLINMWASINGRAYLCVDLSNTTFILLWIFFSPFWWGKRCPFMLLCFQVNTLPPFKNGIIFGWAFICGRLFLSHLFSGRSRYNFVDVIWVVLLNIWTDINSLRKHWERKLVKICKSMHFYILSLVFYFFFINFTFLDSRLELALIVIFICMPTLNK